MCQINPTKLGNVPSRMKGEDGGFHILYGRHVLRAFEICSPRIYMIGTDCALAHGSYYSFLVNAKEQNPTVWPRQAGQCGNCEVTLVVSKALVQSVFAKPTTSPPLRPRRKNKLQKTNKHGLGAEQQENLYQSIMCFYSRVNTQTCFPPDAGKVSAHSEDMISKVHWWLLRASQTHKVTSEHLIKSAAVSQRWRATHEARQPIWIM